MARHHELGATGEAMAVQWLQNKGFLVLHRNWRYSHYEVDIIATLENVLHFVEVKTRRSKKYGEPEESVDKKKLLSLLRAGEAFQYEYPQWKRVQYDVLSVFINPSGIADYFFIEDVYL
ncbi:MAG: YraN family protein [Bacteroidota bacterium]